MNPHYPFVSARARHVCEYCRAPEAVFNKEFEVDHINPQVRGGDSSEGNLALSCRSCNQFKWQYVTAVDARTRKQVGLFNPRLDAWGEHFSLNAETGRIKGLTPRGRATARLLQMNGGTQLKARRTWLRHGLY